ncbi:MAG: hypothetical protein R2774_16220 [Saprospiraceae bacterium]
MKLFLKILFFVLAIFQTNISEAKIVLCYKAIPSEFITSDIFHLQNEKIEVLNVILKNDFGISCKSESNLVDCRNLLLRCEVADIGLGFAGSLFPTSWIKFGGFFGARSHLVYEGLDAAGKVRYVGITGRDAAVRFGEHLNSGTARSLLDYRVIDGATGLSKTGARVWEQTLINQYGLQKNGGMLLNKVNSIAPKNWWQYGIK